MKISKKELVELENALYKVAEVLIKCEASEDEQDLVFVKNMESHVNDLLGETRAFSLGYKQEIGEFYGKKEN